MHMDPFEIYRLAQWVGGLLLFAWIVLLAWGWSVRTAKLRHELRMKVLERFSCEDFVALLQTEDGRRWMAGVLSGRSEPQEMVDASLRQAILLTFLGLGVLAIAWIVGSRFLLASGVLIASGAAGLWVATWTVAHRRGSRQPGEGPGREIL
jgi:protein-S-isoprenylcysteine O-methyltransferase Ste14